ncbi:hypothetical protein D3C86_1888940 [compost metagenome]
MPGMLPEHALVAGSGDPLALGIVPQVEFRLLDQLLLAVVNNHLLAVTEVIAKVVGSTRQQERATSRDLKVAPLDLLARLNAAVG